MWAIFIDAHISGAAEGLARWRKVLAAEAPTHDDLVAANAALIGTMY